MEIYLRVEAVIPDHSEAFFREGTLALEDVVEILRRGVNDPFGRFLTNDDENRPHRGPMRA